MLGPYQIKATDANTKQLGSYTVKFFYLEKARIGGFALWLKISQ